MFRSNSLSSRFERFVHHLTEWFTIGRVGVFLLFISIPGGILNYLLAHPQDGHWLGMVEEFYANFSWELAGIAVTILIIDRLYQRAETKRDQAQLLRQLHSHDHMIVLQALDLLRINGWLEEGLLVNHNLADVDLHNANLRHADLRYAVLRGTNLRNADLRDANLAHADLQDADLQGALLSGVTITESNLQGAKLAGADLSNIIELTTVQLASLSTLAGARWRDSARYDGRFALAGDEQNARMAGYHLGDPTSMARFYQVPLATYLAGSGATEGVFREAKSLW